MTDFTDFIEDAELVDIQLAGDVFTWKKGEGHDPAARLDRFLISEEWENTFKNIKQSTLQRVISDHCPLLLECERWRPQFIARNGKMISEGDNIMLQSQFTEDEIKDCVMACAGDKAPGPDGYTMAFFITCWEVVRKEVVAAVQNFHDHDNSQLST
ncbi:hypothetical protein H5410_002146 [Solanum commersonii]|uniref:Uncharacterized protein n=1 Tax=Solanum commersonii TaxID=4109 RepID=A0A9J6B0V4_SOLCO|nr:hypothetical protein H5410_002146 [Solanum commersonii]